MCGLAGYLTRAPITPNPVLLEALFDGIRTRGPDDEGLCLISRTRPQVVALSTERSVPFFQAQLPSHRDRQAWIPHDLAILHTRYAVMDLSDSGHQPFVSSDGTVVVAFQGEIFNYLELRQDLEALGIRFRTASDTEVLANAYQVWEDDTWPRLNGFWAAAVFDRSKRRFVLCRDRLGVAPLLAAESPAALFFGSSALALASAVGSRADGQRVRDFVETGFKDFDSHTLFEGVRSLPPGTFLTWQADGASLADAKERRYWDVPNQRLSTRDLSLGEAATQLRATLTSAVTYRLRTDRRVAFQLSGGLDSTTITALASIASGQRLTTYTVSVPEQDEAPVARVMETRFALDSTVLTELWKGLLEEGRGFARLMEEPIQAPSAYAHHAMCRRMKADGFGVTLSGSGGDEVLAGYEWDFWPSARTQIRADGKQVDALIQEILFRYGSWPRVSDRLANWARWVGRLPQRLGGSESASRRARDGATSSEGASGLRDATSARALLSRYETLDYDGRRRFHLEVAHLPYYLASNDRATLGIPLEHRQPFLDHRVVELGLRMPPSYLFHKGWTKYVLRKAMEPLLPKEIVWRREKLGFPFPVRRVLREGRSVLAAAAERAVEEGLAGESAWSYDQLLEKDPLRLWRTCSVGLWLAARDPLTARPSLP